MASDNNNLNNAGRKSGLPETGELPDWLRPEGQESGATAAEENPTIASDPDPSTLRTNKPNTGDLPDWLQAFSASTGLDADKLPTVEPAPFEPGPDFQSRVRPFSPEDEEENFSTSASVMMDLEAAGIRPFEPDASIRGMDSGTNKLTMPNTEDLGMGMPDWLRDLSTSPSSAQNKPRASAPAYVQPVFEPTDTSDNDDVPPWLKDYTLEDASLIETPPPPAQNLGPSWLRQITNTSQLNNASKPASSTRDSEIDRRLDDVFEEGGYPELPDEVLEPESDFRAFKIEELPPLNEQKQSENQKLEAATSLPEETIPAAESEPSDEARLDDLFSEVTGSYVPPAPTQVVPHTATNTSDDAHLPDWLRSTSQADNAPSPVVAAVAEPDEAASEAGAPTMWNGLAPWLRGLPLPERELPVDMATLAPFTLDEEQSAPIADVAATASEAALTEEASPDLDYAAPLPDDDALLQPFAVNEEPSPPSYRATLGEDLAGFEPELPDITPEPGQNEVAAFASSEPDSLDWLDKLAANPPPEPEQPTAAVAPLASPVRDTPPPTSQPSRSFSVRDLILQTDELIKKQTDELRLAEPFHTPMEETGQIGDLEEEQRNQPPDEFETGGVLVPFTLSDATDYASPAAEAEQDLPAWLTEAAQPDADYQAAAPAEATGDWQNRIDERPFATSSLGQAELPSWLQAEIAATPPADLAPIAQDTSDDEAAMPAWLRSELGSKILSGLPDATNTPAVPPRRLTTELTQLPELEPAQNEPFDLPAFGTLSEDASMPLDDRARRSLAEEIARQDASQEVEPDTAAEAATETTPNEAELVPFDPAAIEAEIPARIGDDRSTPSWLNALDPALAASSSVTIPDDTPEWLKDEVATSAEEAAPTIEDEPSWLRAFGSGKPIGRPVEDAPKSYSSVGRVEEVQPDLPDWLSESMTPPPGANQIEPPVIGDINTPSWLLKMGQPEQRAAEPPAPLEPATEAKPTAAANTGEDESEVGALLREIALLSDDAPVANTPVWLQSEKEAEPEPEFVLPDDIPDWLRDAPAEPAPVSNLAEPVLGDTPTLAAPEPKPLANEDLNFAGVLEDSGPDWLREAAHPAAPEPPPFPGVVPGPGSETTGGKLPSWLKAVGPTPIETEAARSSESGSPAVAVQDLPVVTIPPELAGAAVLRSLLATPTATAPAATKPTIVTTTAPDWMRWLRYGSFIVLLLAVLLGLLAPQTGMTVPIQATTQSFFDRIEQLQPNQRVLLVYDWEAEQSGEMRPLSQAVTQHLMSRRARLVTLSTNPQGPALANQILDELARQPEYGNAATNFYKYGDGYINLGYRVGSTAAVRSLYNDLGVLEDYRDGKAANTYTVMQNIATLRDFDLVVVLAGDETSLRTWVEQLDPTNQLLLATTTANAPFARPYAIGPNAQTSGQIVRAQGLVTGISGTSQYDQLLRDRGLISNRQLSLDQRLTAQNYAIIALIVIVIVANILFVVMARRKKSS